MSAYPQFALNTSRDISELIVRLEELGFHIHHQEVAGKKAWFSREVTEPQFRHAISLGGWEDYAGYGHYSKGRILDPNHPQFHEFVQKYAQAAKLIYDFADGDLQYSRSGGWEELGALDWYPEKKSSRLDSVLRPIPRVEICPEQIAKRYLPDMYDTTRYILRKSKQGRAGPS